MAIDGDRRDRPATISPSASWRRFISAKEMSCAASDVAGDQAGVLLREEALGMIDEQIDRSAPASRRRPQRRELDAAARRRGRARRRAACASKPRSLHLVEAAVLGLAVRCAGSARPSSASASARRTPRRRCVIVSVTANSRNRRPMMPPISSSGMNTATSETLIETMVKPISPAPLSAASNGFIAVLDMAHDVLEHHDGVVDDEADRDRQRHQREVVEAVADQVHQRAGAEQRQRHRDARDDRRPEAAQEDEDDHRRPARWSAAA